MNLPRFALGIAASLAFVGVSAGDAEAHAAKVRHKHGKDGRVYVDQYEAQRVNNANAYRYGYRANRSRAYLGRFAGMDTNRDGVVTRREWRGNGVSFRANDRNRGGYITSYDLRY